MTLSERSQSAKAMCAAWFCLCALSRTGIPGEIEKIGWGKWRVVA
jgi:hypothetical protein